MCVTPLSRGKLGEVKGELEHHRGKVLEDPVELKKIGVCHPVWEWSRDQTEAGSGECLFFGPYAMDAAEPGLYSVVFRIRGSGFQKPVEISSDWDILLLDVLRTWHKTQLITEGQQTGRTARFPDQDYFARRSVRVSELTKSGWQEYELRFYSDGRGMLEYRCTAYDGTKEAEGGLKDLIKNCGTGVRIFFDMVTVKRVPKFNLPWG